MVNSVAAVLLPLASSAAAPQALAGGQEFLGVQAWLQDFAQLQGEMTDHYANLQWAASQRRLNPKTLADETRAQLMRVSSDNEAHQVFRGFLRRFDDGHLAISWPPATTSKAVSGPIGACSAYRSAARVPGLDLARDGRFREVATPASRYFPAGVVMIRGYGAVGIIRIDLFDEHRFPELCEQARVKLQIEASAPCEDGCAGPLERETANLLTAKLEEQIRALNKQHTKALVVDITNNGGGSNWVGPAARTLTAKPLLEPVQGFIRHRHWAAQFQSRIDQIDSDMKSVRLRDRPLLMRARGAYQRALNAARAGCDQAAFWQNQAPDCRLVSNAGPIYASGVLRYAPPASLPGDASCCYLFGPQRYRYREGVYRGRLFVAVDRETASAAEYFAAILADNRAATLIGERTYGAGCGYTNGGIVTKLKHSRGLVRMPDCVRFRRDGSNEVEGVRPHQPVAWLVSDGPAERTRKFLNALEARLLTDNASSSSLI